MNQGQRVVLFQQETSVKFSIDTPETNSLFESSSQGTVTASAMSMIERDALSDSKTAPQVYTKKHL